MPEIQTSPQPCHSIKQQKHYNRWLFNYEIKQTLGVGSYGKVKLGVDIRTGDLVALKMISHRHIEEKGFTEHFRREMEIHKTIDHPNIVKVIEVIDAPLYGYTCIVMEYLPGSDLHDFLMPRGSLTPKMTHNIFTAVTSAVLYLHSRGVAHRDIKLENIMVDEKGENVKLIDFGFSRLNNTKFFSTFCGSPFYAAPEILTGGQYNISVDIWSLGVLFYALLTGNIPWTGDSQAEQAANTMQGRYTLPEFLSTEARAVITSCLVVDTRKRVDIWGLIRVNNLFGKSLKKNKNVFKKIWTR